MSPNNVAIGELNRSDPVDVPSARGQVDTEVGRLYVLPRMAASPAGVAPAIPKHATDHVPLGEPVPEDILCEGMAGRSAALRNVVAQLQTVAPTDSTVLVCGETGTGKELIARAVHNLSARRSHAFVKCNCAAIPTGLLESELFGHEKGAFTGAVAQRIGRFELANRGTMFLDEIGEAALELQPKLLRVLQDREFERLGNSRTQRTDARLVAATNVNLSEMVDAKRFRADLFYRLNVFPIEIPPLRERPEDIPLLVTHFVHDCARRMHRSIKLIAAATMDVLVRYSWPGNIRELQNLIERAVILSPGQLLQVPISEIDRATKARDAQQTLQEAERAHILAMLEKTRWIVSGPRGAANRLGMKRSTLQCRMKKLGIERPSESEEAAHFM
jgi:formate hydrogenlyase transcriptional activator